MRNRQHRIFKYKILAVLFLFFNCVCAATPVLRLGENTAEAVSARSVQIPNPSENEEENHNSALGYTNHVSRFSVRKQCDQRISDSFSITPEVLFFNIDLPKAYGPDDRILPVHGYYAFLFRYKLF